MLADIHPQFLVDETGERRSVVLSIAEFEALLERIEAFEDAKLLHEIAENSSPEEFENWDEFSARLRAAGKIS